MIELNIIKLYENSNKINEAKADIDNFINKFGEDTYNLFKKSTQRLKNKGISTDLIYHVKHTTKKDLDTILTNLQNRAITKDGNLTELDGDYEYLGQGKGYKVYKINDVIASINLGAETGWCISGRYGHYGEKNYTPSRVEAEKHWNSYTKKGVQFYFFIGNKDKIALALYPKTLSVDKVIRDTYIEKTNCEIYDEQDKLDYNLISNLPLNLINSEIIFKNYPLQNGLYIKDNVVVKCDKSLEEVIIPDNVTSIGRFAFNDCLRLTSVTLGKNVRSIGENAFYNCESLTNIIIPDSVTSIDEWAFADCKSLTNITIPDSVTSIGNHAFAHCTQLKNIIISNSLTSIVEDTFYGCKSLTSITVPNSVKSIGEWAFYRCSSLTSVVIPDSVTSIGRYAFSRCGLTSIKIPGSLTSIDEYVFSDCNGLRSVVIGDGATSIGYAAFADCERLTNIKIPNSMTSIDDFAFYRCESLKSITIGKNVRSIGEGAFRDCPYLTNIQVSANNPNYKSIDGKLYTKDGKLVF